MKTLYFDIDGTILPANEARAKPCLEGGRLESAVRSAGFHRLVCVGNFCHIAAVMKGMGVDFDELGILLGICRGAFVDDHWFRSVTTLVSDPEDRARCIDFTGDWWYLDDLAEEYLRRANREDVLKSQLNGRVFIPDPNGDGRDVLDWLTAVAV